MSSPSTRGPLRVLVAPDSFKGSLSSVAVARALAEGWLRARPADTVDQVPLADGGEGTLDAVAAGGGWDSTPVFARDPLGRPIDARFLRQDHRALIELASASGLSRLNLDERDAQAASTFGTGQVLAAAIGLGCTHVVIGLGGSATTDGGAGLLTALGARFLDRAGADLPWGGGALDRLAAVDLAGLAPLLAEVSLTVACDVTNPLLGPTGAAATYGPQKGAGADQLRQLDRKLGHLADILEQSVSRSIRDMPGSGAAGGTTFGLLAIADRFASLDVRPGVDVVMELTAFADHLAICDLVLTGEGRIDEQTGFGKTAMGVAGRAQAAGRPCLCFGGGVTPAGEEALRAVGALAIPVAEAPMSVSEAMSAGAGPIARAAERVAGIVSMAHDQ